MPQQPETQKPAQVPGDAESPPRREPDPTAGQAVNQTDRTEPTRAPRHPQQGSEPD